MSSKSAVPLTSVELLSMCKIKMIHSFHSVSWQNSPDKLTVHYLSSTKQHAENVIDSKGRLLVNAVSYVRRLKVKYDLFLNLTEYLWCETLPNHKRLTSQKVLIFHEMFYFESLTGSFILLIFTNLTDLICVTTNTTNNDTYLRVSAKN